MARKHKRQILRTTLLFSIVIVAALVPIQQPARAAIGSSPFGAIITAAANQNFFAEAAKDANLAWARIDAPGWDLVEMTEPMPKPDGTYDHPYAQYDWTPFENKLKAYISRGITPVVLIQGTPTWAVDPADNQYVQQNSNVSKCLPIRNDAQENYVQHFAAYAKYVVNRYKGTLNGYAYNVRYWEIWNEPDVARQAVAATTGYNGGYGCWGDQSQNETTYYGGRAFGKMLRAVYPAIKSASPGATVLHGGLMLEGDVSVQVGVI